MTSLAADVAVVGGGVVGTALAYALVQRGARVALFEERSRLGMGSTAAAGGMLGACFEAEVAPAALVDFGVESARSYPDFVGALEAQSGMSAGYHRCGTLFTALTWDDAQESAHVQQLLARKGIAVEELDAAAVQALEPALFPPAHGGLWVADDHWVDPLQLVACLQAGVVSLGGRLHLNHRVTDVVVEGGAVRGVRGVAGEQSFQADAAQVVVATGAWGTGGLVKREGQHSAPLSTCFPGRLRPVKGQTVRLRGEALLRHVVRTPEVYCVPRKDGLVLGATVEEQGFDTRPRAGAVFELMRQGCRVLPAVHELEFVCTTVGLRPAYDDHLPVMDAVPGVSGLWASLGHYRDGILLAPAAASALSETMNTGVRSPSLQAFGFERFGGLGGFV